MNNLTPEESYRVTGTLARGHIEQLLDDALELEKIRDCAGNLLEAADLFPEEDFLDSIIRQFEAVATDMKKGSRNRERLESLVCDLEVLQSEVLGSAGRGRVCLEEIPI